MRTHGLVSSVLALVLSLGALALGTSSVAPASGAERIETETDGRRGAIPAQASCGDYRCSPPEDCNSCPQDCGDCCGDRRCAPPEDCSSCPEDCGRC
jgi:hypothetical protein